MMIPAKIILVTHKDGYHEECIGNTQLDAVPQEGNLIQLVGKENYIGFYKVINTEHVFINNPENYLVTCAHSVNIYVNRDYPDELPNTYSVECGNPEPITDIDDSCPFCGRGRAALIDGGMRFYVHCQHCKSRTGYHNSRDEAWAAWRTRA